MGCRRAAPRSVWSTPPPGRSRSPRSLGRSDRDTEGPHQHNCNDKEFNFNITGSIKIQVYIDLKTIPNNDVILVDGALNQNISGEIALV